jgi:hypothetical protein
MYHSLGCDAPALVEKVNFISLCRLHLLVLSKSLVERTLYDHIDEVTLIRALHQPLVDLEEADDVLLGVRFRNGVDEVIITLLGEVGRDGVPIDHEYLLHLQEEGV